MTELLKISVVVPTYNRGDLLRICLDSLVNQSLAKADYEIIVVNDGSGENVLSVLSEYRCPDLRYYAQKHQGPAVARNLGIRKARYEIIAFIDSDCVADPNWLKEISDCFDANPDALGVEGRTIGTANPFTHQVVSDGPGGYETCNIAYKKSILNDVGGFDTAHFRYPAEDVDLAYTVLKHGTIVFSSKAVVTHPSYSMSLGHRFRRMWCAYCEFRLYDKHPEAYRSMRLDAMPRRLRRSIRPTPVNALILVIFIGGLVHDMKKHRGLWVESHLRYIKLIMLLILERFYLLLLFPIFAAMRMRDKIWTL